MLNKILKVVAIMALIPIFLTGAIITTGAVISSINQVSQGCFEDDFPPLESSNQ